MDGGVHGVTAAPKPPGWRHPVASKSDCHETEVCHDMSSLEGRRRDLRRGRRLREVEVAGVGWWPWIGERLREYEVSTVKEKSAIAKVKRVEKWEGEEYFS